MYISYIVNHLSPNHGFEAASAPVSSPYLVYFKCCRRRKVLSLEGVKARCKTPQGLAAYFVISHAKYIHCSGCYRPAGQHGSCALPPVSPPRTTVHPIPLWGPAPSPILSTPVSRPNSQPLSPAPRPSTRDASSRPHASFLLAGQAISHLDLPWHMQPRRCQHLLHGPPNVLDSLFEIAAVLILCLSLDSRNDIPPNARLGWPAGV